MTPFPETRPAPGGCDPFIQQVAADHRAMALMWLDWQLDSLRITAGLVEAVDEGGRLMLCNRKCAAYAHFHHVRDVEFQKEGEHPQSQEEETNGTADSRRAD